MPYAEGRTYHDADSHVMETPEFFHPFADAAVRAKMRPVYVSTVAPGEESFIDQLRRAHRDPAYRGAEASRDHAPQELEGDGLVPEGRPSACPRSPRLLLAARLSTRSSTSTWCDPSTQTISTLPMASRARTTGRWSTFARSISASSPWVMSRSQILSAPQAIAREAIDQGCRALMVPSACPKGHSPSHTGLFRVWAQAEEAGVPIVFHVGGGGELLDPSYFVNGLPEVKDFHGGAENFRSVDFMAIPYPPMQTLATMIFDRIFDHFPRLKVGVIEQGASWVPGWMRMMDAALDAFRKNEERLQKLALKPSEYVRRQIRVTPYPHEDTGWIIANAGEEVCLFSSDYPHVEGGRHPLRRFEAEPRGCERAREAALLLRQLRGSHGSDAGLGLSKLERIAGDPRIHEDLRALGELTLKDPHGQRVLHHALDDAL